MADEPTEDEMRQLEEALERIDVLEAMVADLTVQRDAAREEATAALNATLAALPPPDPSQALSGGRGGHVPQLAASLPAFDPRAKGKKAVPKRAG